MSDPSVLRIPAKITSIGTRVAAITRAVRDDVKQATFRENLSLLSDVLSVGAVVTAIITFAAVKFLNPNFAYPLFFWGLIIPLPLALGLLVLYPFSYLDASKGTYSKATKRIAWAIVALLAIELCVIGGFLAYEHFSSTQVSPKNSFKPNPLRGSA
jgi:hypothetical protein